jgi:hypothetical protein
MFDILTPKRCAKCGEFKSLSDFHKDRKSKDGHMRVCKTCNKAYARTYYAENTEKVRAYSHAQFLANPEYYRKAAKEREARLRQESAEFREKKSRVFHEWKEKNPERARQNLIRGNNMRRARAQNAEGDYTIEEWDVLVADYGGRCAYCYSTGKLGPDHIIPLAHRGTNSIENIVPACPKCNYSKQANNLLVWLWKRLNNPNYGIGRGRGFMNPKTSGGAACR